VGSAQVQFIPVRTLQNFHLFQMFQLFVVRCLEEFD
jgi:hypothetical protein